VVYPRFDFFAHFIIPSFPDVKMFVVKNNSRQLCLKKSMMLHSHNQCNSRLYLEANLL